MLPTPIAAVLTVALAWAMIMVAATLSSKMWSVQGIQRAFGNRDDEADLAGITGRADRAAKNMLENLVLYAALLAAAGVAQTPLDELAPGANLFLVARLVYWGVYLAGIPGLRTAVWFVAVAGLGWMGWAITT